MIFDMTNWIFWLEKKKISYTLLIPFQNKFFGVKAMWKKFLGHLMIFLKIGPLNFSESQSLKVFQI